MGRQGGVPTYWKGEKGKWKREKGGWFGGEKIRPLEIKLTPTKDLTITFTVSNISLVPLGR